MRQIIREVPFLMKSQLIFGQTFSIFGLFFFTFGFIFVLAFVTQTDFQSFRFDENSPTVKGTITKIKSTNASENKKYIYAYHYKCSLGEGVSYETSMNIEEGATVDIVYLSSNPKIHKIKHMRTQPFDITVLFVLIFPAVGALLAFFGISKGLNAVEILQYGEIGYGKYIRSVETNVRVNKQKQYEMFFEFIAKDGKTHKAVATTHLTQRLKDEEMEQLVYLPDNPEKCFLLDEYLSISKLDEKGSLNFKPTSKNYFSLILPSIALIEIFIFIAMMLG
jgi:hypothetical protein